jgi:hypothetical protein
MPPPTTTTLLVLGALGTTGQAWQDGAVGMRIVEEQIRLDPPGVTQRLRVDLHGVAVFGPDDDHVAIRWEWVNDITAGEHVVVSSASDAITIPAGSFGLAPDDLAGRLERARSITERPEVIAELARGGAPG